MLLDILFAENSSHSLRLPGTVFEEVKRNLSAEAFKEFILLLLSANIPIDEDALVPFELGMKWNCQVLNMLMLLSPRMQNMWELKF